MTGMTGRHVAAGHRGTGMETEPRGHSVTGTVKDPVMVTLETDPREEEAVEDVVVAGDVVEDETSEGSENLTGTVGMTKGEGIFSENFIQYFIAKCYAKCADCYTVQRSIVDFYIQNHSSL